MSDWELLFMVRLPLALPIIIAGIRVSTIYILSWATLSALIGAEARRPYLQRHRDLRFYLIAAGTIPTALLALIASGAMNQIEYSLTARVASIELK